MPSPAQFAPSSVQPRSLEDVFFSHADSVYHFLYARVGNREDAEDLTSQVFLKAARQLDSARSEPSVLRWLFTVARTVLADHWRRYYRAPAGVEFSDELVAKQPAGDWTDDSTSAAGRLVEAVLEGLPPRYRRVLELRFLQGYTIDEAAAEMAVTPGNLKVIQHRALARAAEIGLPSWHTDRGQAPPPSLQAAL